MNDRLATIFKDQPQKTYPGGIPSYLKSNDAPKKSVESLDFERRADTVYAALS